MTPPERITLVGMGVSILLSALKFSIGLRGGSLALLADGFHSASDLVTDALVLGGLRIARKPADRNHAYGHGKFETLAAAVVALALFSVSGYILAEAIFALAAGKSVSFGPEVAAVAALSVVGKEWLFRATVRIGKAHRRSSLLANAWHHRSDALSSLAVLLGGVLVPLGVRQADQVAAIAVAALIGWAALGILRRAFHELAEGALSPEDQTKIAQAIAAVPGVADWHNLRTRFSGPTVFVDVHIQVDPSLTVAESHAIASQVEGAVRAALGGQTSCVVHVEPRSASDED